jgi:hypothetical protein
MSTRRRAITTLTAIALAGLVTAPAAVAASHRPAVAAGGSAEVGAIAYITNTGTVRLKQLGLTGPIGSAARIGPVTTKAKGETRQVFDLVVSGDGQWVAWDEVLVSRSTFKSVLVAHAVVSGKTYRLRTAYLPVGFAKDELIVTNESQNRSLHLSPAPHLVKFTDSQPALAAFPDGVVDGTYTDVPHSRNHIDQVRLVTFGGTRVVLHSYTLSPTNYRDIDAAWVSSDARMLVIERGNHQDFDGLGPSSLADRFSLSDPHNRTALGHFGTNAAKWRIASVAFQGSSDKVWAIWERDGQHGPQTIAASYSHGAWHKFATPGAGNVGVAGSTNGYVVVQPGKLVRSNPHDNGFSPVATKPAVLVHGTTQTPIGVRGPELVWVTKPLVPTK